MFLRNLSFLLLSAISYATQIDKNSLNNQSIEAEYSHDIENSNQYITASTMYNTKNYEKSYEMFNKLFLQNNTNININYFFSIKCHKNRIIR